MRGWRLLTPAIFAAAGILFVTSAVVARGTDLRTGERTSVADVIAREQANVADLGAHAEDLRAEIDKMTASIERRDGRLAEARAKIDTVAPAAGMRGVKGPAVTVLLDDAPTPPAGEPIPEGLNVDSYVVHQQDVQAVVNALWAGGAEAMMLMDQRVISTSAVRCVGSLLILQGRTYPPPYKITAIGDQDALLAALDASRAVSNYRDYVPLIGLGYKVEVEPSVTMPGFAGALNLSHARVAS
ncbi:MAG TPA: DUF881 domain-containing protein [Actinomycetes bacterium]|nr:DUF881 domain-containing protein [Actinomycetes bacterium]